MLDIRRDGRRYGSTTAGGGPAANDLTDEAGLGILDETDVAIQDET